MTDRICPNCGSKVMPESRFCGNCGQPMADGAGAAGSRTCPMCGSEVPAGIKFCTECGHHMEDTGAQQGAVTGQTAPTGSQGAQQPQPAAGAGMGPSGWPSEVSEASARGQQAAGSSQVGAGGYPVSQQPGTGQGGAYAGAGQNTGSYAGGYPASQQGTGTGNVYPAGYPGGYQQGTPRNQGGVQPAGAPGEPEEKGNGKKIAIIVVIAVVAAVAVVALVVAISSNLGGSSGSSSDSDSEIVSYLEDCGTFDEVTISGTGDDEVELPVTGMAMLMDITHEGDGLFEMYLLDDSGEIVWGCYNNGPCSDTMTNRPYGYSLGESYDYTATTVQITADGDWSITFKPMSTMEELVSGQTYDGSEVLYVDSDSIDGIEFTFCNDSDEYFTVYASAMDNYGYLVDADGDYEGTYYVDETQLILEINSDGEWSVTMEGSDSEV